jgi:hypothetical protein
MEEERRQNPRARVNWPVSIQTKEGTIERATYNVSHGGAFIRGLSPVEVQEVVDMVISGIDYDITTKARVVWTRSQDPAEGERPRDMGVEFVKISDEHREIIASLVLAEMEFSGPEENEEEQSLTKEKGLIEKQSLLEEKQVKEEKEDMKKATLANLRSAQMVTGIFPGLWAMSVSSVGTATGGILYLPVLDHQKENFPTLRGTVTSLDPNDIKRVKVYPVKCSRCKANLLIRATEKVCPACGGLLSKPVKR